MRSAFVSRTFYALENREFRVLWWGTVLFHLGQQMQVLARGYLAFELTGRNSALGAVLLAYGIPQLLFAAWGGAAADRFAKRNILWIAESGLIASSAWLALMVGLDLVGYWMLIVVSAVHGVAFAFVVPARQAYVASLVDRDALGNAVVLQTLAQAGTRVIGPSVAGLFIGVSVIGVGGVYAGTTILITLGALSRLRLPAGLPTGNRKRKAPLREWSEALGYAVRRPAISQLLLVFFAMIILGMTYASFLPSLAKREYGAGASGLGWLSSSAAVGAVLATIAVAGFAQHRRAWFFQPILAAGFGLSLIGLGLAPNFGLGLVAVFVVGGMAAAFQSLNNSLVILLTEPEYHGRVQSISHMAWGIWGLTSFPIGVVADHIGVRETMVLLGAACLVCVALFQVVGRLRKASEDRLVQPARLEPRTAEASGG